MERELCLPGSHYFASGQGDCACGIMQGEQDVAPDMINSPPHYTNHPTGVECIDIIEECASPNLYSAMKYQWRVNWAKGPKNTPEQKRKDLQIAIWHLKRELGRMEK